MCLNAGGDTDGDGLCDDWEKDGLTVTVDGRAVFLDLPAMGADPNHKDIFLQLDTIPGRSVTQDTLNAVIKAFAEAPVINHDREPGINLHIDNGPNSIMKPGANWGNLSRALPVDDVANLGNYDAQGSFS
jgi:hypothetical protein